MVFSNPKYNASLIKACPILTSSIKGICWTKKGKLCLSKSCPALMPYPSCFAFSAALRYASIISSFLPASNAFA